MKKSVKIGAGLLTGLCSISSYGAGVNGDAVISDVVGISTLKIYTCDKDAGAICRMTWKNKELVDDLDHGRQIQTAITYDGLGEGYNPTEAGSRFNGTSNNSSSYLNSISVSGDSLSSETLAAFWLRPNECTTAGVGACATNTTIRSKTKIKKEITIGFGNMPHVVEMLVEVTVEPSSSSTLINFDKATFKIMSGHFRGSLNDFYTYDKSTGLLFSESPALNTNTSYQDPVVISNSDGSIAIGYYTPDSNVAQYNHNYNMSYFPGAGSGISGQSDMTKLVDVYRLNNPTASTTYSFRTYMTISSLENATTVMENLVNYFE